MSNTAPSSAVSLTRPGTAHPASATGRVRGIPVHSGAAGVVDARCLAFGGCRSASHLFTAVDVRVLLRCPLKCTRTCNANGEKIKLT